MEAVFVDTSVVRQHNVHLDSAVFTSLKAFAAKGSLVVVTTDVTLREIDARVDELVDEAAVAIKEASKRARFLGSLVGSALTADLAGFDAERCKAEKKKAVREFFASPGFEVIDASATDARPIFDSYFEGKPPFGPGKKKSEFPDAFVLSALMNWAKTRGIPLTVVSIDGDLRDACTQSGTPFEESLPAFVQKLQDAASLVKEVREAFRHLSHLLLPAMDRALSETSLTLDDAPDGEVEGVTVLSVDVEEVYVVSVTKHSAAIECYAVTTVKARISYADESTRWYDSEDKRGGYLERIHTEIKRDLDIPAEVSIAFNDDPADFEVVQIVLNHGDGVDLQLFDPEPE